MQNRSKTKGFSLIEMLISLLVIGIACVFIVPRMSMQSTKIPQVKGGQIVGSQNPQFKAGLRTSFSNIDNATRMILLNNGGVFSGICNDNKCLAELYSKQLNVINYCDSQINGKCWHNNGNWKYLNGKIINGGFNTAAGLTLINGSFIAFNNANSACSGSICGRIYVDVNGFNGPNTIGIDIFLFNILNNSVVPYGIGSSNSDCTAGSSDNSNTGLSCTAKYLNNQ